MNEALRKRLLERGHDGKPSHPYVPAGETDIRKLFKRLQESPPPATNVKPLRKGVKP